LLRGFLLTPLQPTWKVTKEVSPKWRAALGLNHLLLIKEAINLQDVNLQCFSRVYPRFLDVF
jgi:hypothetical protein